MNFAYEIGFGKELTAVMYLLQKVTITTKVKLSVKLKASHPHIASRIRRLEQLENEDIA